MKRKERFLVESYGYFENIGNFIVALSPPPLQACFL